MRTGYFGRGNERGQSADKVHILLKKAAEIHAKKVILAPFMVVAGDHAIHDISGYTIWDAHMVYVDGALFAIYDFHKSADCSAAFACSI